MTRPLHVHPSPWWARSGLVTILPYHRLGPRKTHEKEGRGVMVRMEIHPGEGGADAQAFALELASAVSKFTGRAVRNGVGGTLVLDRL